MPLLKKSPRKAPVAVNPRESRPWGALSLAAGVALLITVGAMISVNQAVKTQSKTVPVWVTTALVSGGSTITASDVTETQVPQALGSLLYTGSSPIGKAASVTLLKGTVLVPVDVGGRGVVIPQGEIGVWVATTPTQDGSLSLGQLVLPYVAPQSGVSGTTPAQTLTNGPVRIVAISGQSGTLQGSVGGSVGIGASNAPVAVELAVPSASAAALIAAVANHTVILAVPGGGR